LRDLNALLNQNVPDATQPFAYNLHRVITQYGKLLQGYLDYERTDRTVRRRDNRTHGQIIIRLERIRCRPVEVGIAVPLDAIRDGRTLGEE
jgi:hypothetical protein